MASLSHIGSTENAGPEL